MNTACNWPGTLTRENRELTKADLNQPQRIWKNWSSVPDCKCSWPWGWVLDLRKTCDSQNFLGILEVDLNMLGQALSLQMTVVQDRSSPLGNQNWRGEGIEAQYETESGSAVHSPLALLWGCVLWNNQIPSLSFMYMHVPQILSISCLLPTQVLVWAREHDEIWLSTPRIIPMLFRGAYTAEFGEVTNPYRGQLSVCPLSWACTPMSSTVYLHLQGEKFVHTWTNAMKWICCMPEWFVFKFDGNQVNVNTHTHTEHCNYTSL